MKYLIYTIYLSLSFYSISIFSTAYDPYGYGFLPQIPNSYGANGANAVNYTSIGGSSIFAPQNNFNYTNISQDPLGFCGGAYPYSNPFLMSMGGGPSCAPFGFGTLSGGIANPYGTAPSSMYLRTFDQNLFNLPLWKFHGDTFDYSGDYDLCKDGSCLGALDLSTDRNDKKKEKKKKKDKPTKDYSPPAPPANPQKTDETANPAPQPNNDNGTQKPAPPKDQPGSQKNAPPPAEKENPDQDKVETEANTYPCPGPNCPNNRKPSPLCTNENTYLEDKLNKIKGHKKLLGDSQFESIKDCVKRIQRDIAPNLYTREDKTFVTSCDKGKMKTTDVLPCVTDNYINLVSHAYYKVSKCFKRFELRELIPTLSVESAFHINALNPDELERKNKSLGVGQIYTNAGIKDIYNEPDVDSEDGGRRSQYSDILNDPSQFNSNDKICQDLIKKHSERNYDTEKWACSLSTLDDKLNEELPSNPYESIFQAALIRSINIRDIKSIVGLESGGASIAKSSPQCDKLLKEFFRDSNSKLSSTEKEKLIGQLATYAHNGFSHLMTLFCTQVKKLKEAKKDLKNVQFSDIDLKDMEKFEIDNSLFSDDATKEGVEIKKSRYDSYIKDINTTLNEFQPKGMKECLPDGTM